MSGFATWGQAIQRIPAGETVFGTPINVLEAPFLHGVTIVEAPLLRPYTAIALTSSEVYIRNKRNPYWNLRGNRGDMVEGDWIAEMAIEVVNESHHAWVEGITAFSRQLIVPVRGQWSVVRCGAALGSRAGRRARLCEPRHLPDPCVARPSQPYNGQRTTDHETSIMWRFRGSPYYLDQQAKRLGITQVLADRARHNTEIYQLAVLLAQLSERYHRARKENGKPVFYTTELAQIKGTLEQCELELQKLHMLAGRGRRDARRGVAGLRFHQAAVEPLKSSSDLRHQYIFRSATAPSAFPTIVRGRWSSRCGRLPSTISGPDVDISIALKAVKPCPMRIPMSSRPGRRSPSFKRAALPVSLERLIAANSAAESNPTTAATLSATAGGTAGGLLAPGVYYVNFTETNGYGETTVSAESGPVTVAAQAAPTGTPTVVVSGTGGTLPAGVYRGKFTYVDSNLNASGAFGETTAGTEFSFTQTSGAQPIDHDQRRRLAELGLGPEPLPHRGRRGDQYRSAGVHRHHRRRPTRSRQRRRRVRCPRRRPTRPRPTSPRSPRSRRFRPATRRGISI